MLFSQDYREILKHELTERVKRNPRYSLRAFASLVNLAPARLSDILLYKKGMSSNVAREVAKALQFSEHETNFFCVLVESLHARNTKKRQEASLDVQKFIKEYHTYFLQVDSFETISDINYLCLLQLIKIQNSKSSLQALSCSMNLTSFEVETMLARLIRLGLVKEHGNAFQVIHETVILPDQIASDAIKNVHQQILNKAMLSMHSQGIEQRDYFATIFPLNPKRLEIIQKSVREFVGKLIDEHSDSSEGSTVYCYSSQLFKLVDKV